MILVSGLLNSRNGVSKKYRIIKAEARTIGIMMFQGFPYFLFERKTMNAQKRMKLIMEKHKSFTVPSKKISAHSPIE